MNFTTTELLVPAHWLSAIINGDESGFDYYDDPVDYAAYQAFMENEIGTATVTTVEDDSEPQFYRHHDASGYGVLACDCVPILVLNPE
jgi:hypothetical protein